MKTNHETIEGWTFEEEEISAGVYRVTAIDRMGRKVARTGTDPRTLQLQCRQDAEGIQHGLGGKVRSIQRRETGPAPD